MFAWGNLEKWMIFDKATFLAFIAETNCDPCNSHTEAKISGGSSLLKMNSAILKHPVIKIDGFFLYKEHDIAETVADLATEVS